MRQHAMKALVLALNQVHLLVGQGAGRTRAQRGKMGLTWGMDIPLRGATHGATAPARPRRDRRSVRAEHFSAEGGTWGYCLAAACAQGQGRTGRVGPLFPLSRVGLMDGIGRMGRGGGTAPRPLLLLLRPLPLLLVATPCRPSSEVLDRCSYSHG